MLFTRKIKISGYSFNTKIEKTALSLLKKISKYEKIYFVGGYPRDILLNRKFNKKYEVTDIDFCISSTNIELKEIFKNLNLEFKALNDNLGVYLIYYRECEFEIACFREDISIGNGRRPDKIKFTKSIRKDSKRRDFTINAFYFDPISMTIFDFNNGSKDLDNKVLRFIGNPKKRIKEDYIRILRFFRFKNKYNFSYIEKEYELIRKYVKNLSTINQDKVRIELGQIFSLSNAKNIFFELDKAGVFEIVLPEFKAIDNINYKMEGIDIFKDTIEQEYLLESNAFYYLMIKYFRADEKICTETSVKDYITSVFGKNILWAIIFNNLGRVISNDSTDESTQILFDNYEQAAISISNDVMKRLGFNKKDKEDITYIILNQYKIKNFDELNETEKKYLLSNRHFREVLIVFLTTILKNFNTGTIEEVEDKIRNYKNIILTYNSINDEINKILGFLDQEALDVFRIEKDSQFFYKIIEELEVLFFDGKIKTKNGVIKFLENKTGIIYK